MAVLIQTFSTSTEQSSEMLLVSQTISVDSISLTVLIKLVPLMVSTMPTLSACLMAFLDSMATLSAVLPPASEVPEVLASSEELASPMTVHSSSLMMVSFLTMDLISMPALPLAQHHSLPVVLAEQDLDREVVLSSSMTVPVSERVLSSQMTSLLPPPLLLPQP